MAAAAVAHFQGLHGRSTRVGIVEWKTCGHHGPGLHDSLVGHGFAPGKEETVMLGDAATFAAGVPCRAEWGCAAASSRTTPER